MPLRPYLFEEPGWRALAYLTTRRWAEHMTFAGMTRRKRATVFRFISYPHEGTNEQPAP